MIKKKIKIRKPETPITRGHGVEELEEDGDFVIDGYSLQIPTGQSKIDIDDLTLDEDDYELQQEVAHGMESEDSEPIAVDRYFRRIR
tara:strand:+ start:226 stop:486 length:261 start_codon:yes stop_codon:yes gene_type:complete